METLIKNSATVASIYEAFGKGDIPFIISQLDKNVLWVVMGERPNAIAGISKALYLFLTFLMHWPAITILKISRCIIYRT